MYLPFVQMLISVLALFLVCHKIKAGLLLGILSQGFWIIYSFTEDQPGATITSVLYGFILYYLAYMKLDLFKTKVRIERCGTTAPWVDYDGGVIYCERPKHEYGRHRSGDWDWSVTCENKNASKKKEGK